MNHNDEINEIRGFIDLSKDKKLPHNYDIFDLDKIPMDVLDKGYTSYSQYIPKSDIQENNIIEGIDVDINRRVTMTDEHENLVDTSFSNNPTVLKNYIPNINVWSIFKRKQGDVGDGNPLLYALKHEGYTLTNEKKVKNRIEGIVNKVFANGIGADLTLMIPSTNDLNNYFARLVASKCKNTKVVDNLFVKMTVEEVDDFIFDENSEFRKFYGKNFEKKRTIFLNYCKKMKDVFIFHLVKDMEMRKVIEHTIKLADSFYGEYIDAINDKDVLIIDDSITLGNTIKEACTILTSVYTPKSINILTLFSPLYDSDGKSLA